MYQYRLLTNRSDGAFVEDYSDDGGALRVEERTKKYCFLITPLIVLCFLLILTGIILIYQAFGLYIKSATFWKELYDAGKLIS
ncbi:expressed protein [Echinococcus multilocularis]|uniref:Expressed protein n=1 Tax=Echinococcus multilocularis TaxID=6211 RepID=A0A068YMG4_ECHMU|nr:expressed protein [Echinococcus multilocularis]